jgi:acetylornithine/N-succinyldiaminopimelate aminotransferase
MNFLEREAKVFFHTYKRIPLEIERGEGVYVFDNTGRRYLDMFAGLAVNALGYNHRGILEAIERQVRRYIHLSNYYLQDTQIELAELLIKATGYSKVFLCNSGTEAIEGALKLARKWGREKNKSTVISFSNAFHGRTMGALSSMDRAKYRNGYEPFLPGFLNIPFNDADILRKSVDSSTLAVLLEFIQGEGGINVAERNFVDQLQLLQQQHGFLIIADEIQAGLGRTGKFFSFQHYGNISPDIVAIAKPLGGGLPLGTILGSERVASVLDYGVHGTTFGGNPVACAAGIVVLNELVRGGLMENVVSVGEYLHEQLNRFQREFPTLIAEVRGKGLMVGVELTREGDSIVEQMRNEGVLINCTNQTVLRFLPPLIVTTQHVDEAMIALRKVFRTLSL